MGAASSTLRTDVITRHLVEAKQAIAETERLTAAQKKLGKGVDALADSEVRVALARQKAAKAGLDAAAAGEKGANRFVEGTNKMRKGVGFVTGAVGAFTSGLNVAGMAVGALETVFDQFSAKTQNAAGRLADEIGRLGGNANSIVGYFSNMERAAASLGARMEQVTAAFMALDKARAKIEGDRQEKAVGAYIDQRARGKTNVDSLKYLIGEKTRELDSNDPGSLFAQLDAANAANDSAAVAAAEKAIAFAMDVRTEATERLGAAEKKLGEQRKERAKEAEKAGKKLLEMWGGHMPGDLTSSTWGGSIANAERRIIELDTYYALGRAPREAVGGGTVRPRVPIDVNSGLLGDTGFGAEQFGFRSYRNLVGQGIGDAYAQQLSFDNQPTILERVFGKPDSIAMITEALGALSGAADTAFQSWVSGSVSASEAFRKFQGDAAGALAGIMFTEAKKHAAYAIGHLAGGDFRGAALHGAAAVAFGAGAVLAGKVARELGGKTTGSSSEGGAGSAAYGGRRGPETGGPTNIYVGDEWASMSPRERASRAEDVMDAARRRGSSMIVRYG